jgi:hypothetical protein
VVVRVWVGVNYGVPCARLPADMDNTTVTTALSTSLTPITIDGQVGGVVQSSEARAVSAGGSLTGNTSTCTPTVTFAPEVSNTVVLTIARPNTSLAGMKRIWGRTPVSRIGTEQRAYSCEVGDAVVRSW